MSNNPHIELLDTTRLQRLFTNNRGERVNAKVELLSDPAHGDAWRAWAARYLPADIFRTFQLIDAPGSDEWLNVVEHCIFTAAASLTLANDLTAAGVRVDKDTVVHAAIVHDATKRIDVEHHKSRESEPYDTLLANELMLHGYSFEVILAALNTSRSADRYISDPRIRMDHIRGKGVEAAVVGYCDARIRGSRMYSLQEAKAANLAAKTRPQDIKFFEHYWGAYYHAVESYLRHMAPGLELASLTDQHIFSTISGKVHGQPH